MLDSLRSLVGNDLCTYCLFFINAFVNAIGWKKIQFDVDFFFSRTYFSRMLVNLDFAAAPVDYPIQLVYRSLYYINFPLPVNPNGRPTSSQEAALLALQLNCGCELMYNEGHFSTVLINRRDACSSLQINEFVYSIE